ncbi:hypothetical protein LIA77_03922 [Sarocladium implicatum]|jgi:hypothetical protein|nr:hypothetical protein LIA77_03922 [Sarocladium implicatum]
MAPEALPKKPASSSSATSRATANDISLLFNARAARTSKLLARLTSSSSSSAAATTTQPAQTAHTTESQRLAEDKAFTTTAGGGVGYIPTPDAKKGDAATTALRDKLLGKRKGRGQERGRGAKGNESEEDEDEGRSGLGRRKKAQKLARDDKDLVEDHVQEEPVEAADGDDERVDDASRIAAAEMADAVTIPSTNKSKKRKKSKNKAKAREM